MPGRSVLRLPTPVIQCLNRLYKLRQKSYSGDVGRERQAVFWPRGSLDGRCRLRQCQLRVMPVGTMLVGDDDEISLKEIAVVLDAIEFFDCGRPGPVALGERLQRVLPADMMQHPAGQMGFYPGK